MGVANADDVFDANACRSTRRLPWDSTNSSQAFNKVQHHVWRVESPERQSTMAERRLFSGASRRTPFFSKGES